MSPDIGNPIKILCVVPNGYLPWLRGGLEITADLVGEALVDLPAMVYVAAATDPVKAGWRMRLWRRLCGPYIHCEKIGRQSVFTDLYHPTSLQHLVERLRPDVVLCHIGGPDTTVRELIAINKPTVFYVHTSKPGDNLAAIGNMEHFAFVAVSSFVADAIASSAGTTSEVVPPLMYPQLYETPLTGDAILVVNPDPQKGGELIVEIAALMPHRHFLVVGGWEHNRQHAGVIDVEAALAKLPNVTRIAHIEDMREIFSQSRCLLMPCIVEEAFGRAAAEAQIAGIPVLGSNRGALPETIGLGGEILPLEAPIGDWVSILDKMCDDETYYHSRKSAALCEARKTCRQPEVIVAKLRELVSSIGSARTEVGRS